MSPCLRIIFFTLIIGGMPWARAEECTNSLMPLAPEVVSEGAVDFSRVAQLTLDKYTYLNPELLNSVDLRLLAKMLVRRVYDTCDSLRDPQKQKPPAGERDVVMLVSEANLASIRAQGFENEHQSGRSGGCHCAGGRFLAEMGQLLLGLPYGERARELLPKYALQVFHDNSMGANPLPSSFYGNVMIRFKPDVLERSTWTARDSLGIDLAQSPARSNGVGTPSQTHTCQAYCEAQVWGPLDASDVAAIQIPRNTPITSAMKSFGVPIYFYDAKPPLKVPPCVRGNCPDPVVYPSSGSSLWGLQVDKAPAYVPSPGERSTSTRLAPSPYDGKTTEDLIAQYRALPVAQHHTYLEYEIHPAEPDIGAVDGPKARLLAEIASRPKNSAVFSFLKQEWDSGPSETIRGLALGGLSQLGYPELKPILVKSLQASPDGKPKPYLMPSLLRRTADFIALEHLDHKEVRDAMAAQSLESKRLAERFLSQGTRCSQD